MHTLRQTTALLFSLYIGMLFPSALVAQEAPANIPENLEISPEKQNHDQGIKSALDGIFEQIPDLAGISVSVKSGVVTLSGVVADSKAAIEAVALTKNTNGVIYVKDSMEQKVDVASRLEPAKEKAAEIGHTIIRKLPLLLVSITIAASFWLFGTWISRRKFLYKKLGLNDMVSSLLRRFIRLTLIAIGIFFALEVMDATTIASAVLGVAGVAGIALGFAFRNIVENYLAGILLSMRNPFSTGDSIEVDGLTGKVIRLTSRDTVLMTYEGNHLRIPNSTIMTSAMTNFTRNPLRRFDFAVGVSVELDLVEVKDLGMTTLLSLNSIITDPAPQIVIEELGDSTVNMRFYAWIDQRKSDFMKSKSEAIRLVKDAFDEHGIEMPEPLYRLVVKGGDGTIASTQQSSSAKDAPKPKPRSTQSEHDTAADHSIDKQLNLAQRVDSEENLLESSD